MHDIAKDWNQSKFFFTLYVQIAEIQLPGGRNYYYDIERGNRIEGVLAETEYRVPCRRREQWYVDKVDFQKGQDVVSLKTVDTNGSSWMNRMRSEIRDLSGSGTTVNGQPANMILDIRTQPGGAERAQSLIGYGRQWGVTVTVRPFP